MTHSPSSTVADRPPAMYLNATTAIVVSSTSMKVGMMTTAAISHGCTSARDPEVLRRLCGTYAMGPIEVVVALRGDRVLTVTVPGAPPFELEPAGRGLRFGLKGQPAVTAEFELDDSGAAARLVAQPLGIFHPQP